MRRRRSQHAVTNEGMRHRRAKLTHRSSASWAWSVGIWKISRWPSFQLVGAVQASVGAADPFEFDALFLGEVLPSAPRGARSYPRHSRERLEGIFLGLMTYPDAERRRGRQHVRELVTVFRYRNGAPGDPCYKAKAGLFGSQFPAMQLPIRRKVPDADAATCPGISGWPGQPLPNLRSRSRLTGPTIQLDDCVWVESVSAAVDMGRVAVTLRGQTCSPTVVLHGTTAIGSAHPSAGSRRATSPRMDTLVGAGITGG